MYNNDMVKNNSLRFRSKIWLESEDGEVIFSYGKMKLLKEIDKTGSISKAAEEMDISFRKAWAMVKTINERAKKPIILTKTGGKGGGGAQLTKEGKEIVNTYFEINNQVEHLLKMMENAFPDI